jgi:hypothetical protein
VHWDQAAGFIGCVYSVKPSQVHELDLDHPQRAHHTARGCGFREDGRLVAGDRLLGFGGGGGGGGGGDASYLVVDS